MYSPRELILQLTWDMSIYCRVEFGAYVEVYDDWDVTNSMKARARHCIALGPTGNLQGSIKCFDLKTGIVLHRRNFE